MSQKNKKTTVGNPNKTSHGTKPRPNRRVPKLKAAPRANTGTCGGMVSCIDRIAPWMALGPVWIVIHEGGHGIVAWAMGCHPYAITLGSGVRRPIRGIRLGTAARWKIGRAGCRTRSRDRRQIVFLLAGSTREGLGATSLWVVVWLRWPAATEMGGLVEIWLGVVATNGLLHAVGNLRWHPREPRNFPRDGRRLCHRRPSRE